jgi:hypothetical protein
LKDIILVDENGINGMGDEPTGSLSQAYLASGDKRAIPWDVINKFIEDDAMDNMTPSGEDNMTPSGEDNVKGAAKVNATSSKEDNIEGEAKVNTTSSKKSSSEAKLAKLAKLVKMAKSTDLWCLLPFVPSTQEAKAKQRNLWGEVCTADNCVNKHPKVMHLGQPRQGEDLEGHVQAVAQAGPVQNPGQAGQASCQARGQGQCQGAQGKDQGGKDDVARRHLQPGGRGTRCPLSTTRPRCTTQQQQHVAAEAGPAGSYTGRSNCNARGGYRAAADSSSAPVDL